MSAEPPSARPSSRTWLWAGGLVAAALVLRLIGVSYGLPAIYNPDEVAIMSRALAFATADLNPHNFLYPSLYFYVLFGWETLLFVAGWTTGVFASIGAFERVFFVDPSPIYLAGRVLSAVLGALTVAATCRLGTRLFDRRVGLASAALLAVAPIAVRDGHYVKHDVPVTFLLVLAHVGMAGLLVDPVRRASRRSWIGAGLLAGLACSTHYYAVFVLLPLALIALAPGPRPTDEWTRPARLAWTGLAAVAAFVLTSPFILIEPATAWRDVVANREIVVDRALAPAGPFASLPRYLALLATDGVGWPVLVAAGAGLAIATVLDWRRAALLSIFPIAFLLFIANTVPASRYLNPVLPFVSLAAGLALVRIASVWRQRSGLAAAIVVGLAAAPALALSVRTGQFFRQPDTRTLALSFVHQTVRPGASILVQPYSVPLRPSREGLVEALRANLGSENRASTRFRRQLALDPYPEPAYRLIYLGDGGLDAEKIYIPVADVTGADPLDAIREHAVTYVVLKRYNGVDQVLQPLQAALAREGRLLATFSPYAAGAVPSGPATETEPFLHNTDARIHPLLARPGPTIEIWQIDP